jgi:hypothetical protein
VIAMAGISDRDPGTGDRHPGIGDRDAPESVIAIRRNQ